MSTMFDDRERAFEAKYALDEAMRFRAGARRDKLLAHWAAGRAGLPDAETTALVDGVIHIPDRAGHDGAILAYIGAALARHGAAATDAELAAALQHCAAQARAELMAAPLDIDTTP